MKATGIVRRIDDLGRVVIPKVLNPTALSCIFSASISNAFKIIFWIAVTA